MMMDLGTDYVLRWNSNVFEEDLGCVRTPMADLLDVFGYCNPFRVHWNTNQRFVGMRLAFPGVGQHAHPVGLLIRSFSLIII